MSAASELSTRRRRHKRLSGSCLGSQRFTRTLGRQGIPEGYEDLVNLARRKHKFGTMTECVILLILYSAVEGEAEPVGFTDHEYAVANDLDLFKGEIRMFLEVRFGV